MCMYVYLRPQRARERHREAIDFCEGDWGFMGSGPFFSRYIQLLRPLHIHRLTRIYPQNPNASIYLRAPRASSAQYNMLQQNLHVRYPQPETTTPQARRGINTPVWRATGRARRGGVELGLELQLEPTRPHIHYTTLPCRTLPHRTASHRTASYASLPYAPPGRPATHFPTPLHTASLHRAAPYRSSIGRRVGE
jgi:hypothetical protein